MGTSPQTFDFRYGFWRPLLSVLGLGPARTGVQVDEQTMRVKMGWGFRSANRWAGIGVHGWAGQWLVNGSVAGIVRITIDPPSRASVLGVSVRLRLLEISLEDPDGFVAAVEAVAG